MDDMSNGPVDAGYLDHAASTPMYPEAVAAMTAQLTQLGNPSSLHASGRAARRVVEESRETIASALNCRPGEVVFTSGGTESDNLALKGLFWARRAQDPRRTRILSTSVEHHPVLPPLSARCTGWPSTRAPTLSCCPSTTWAASTCPRCGRRWSATPAASRWSR